MTTVKGAGLIRRYTIVFWVVFLVVGVTRITDEIGTTTTPLFIDDLTGRVTDLTTVFLAAYLPATLIALFAGPLIDRVDRRLLLMAIDTVGGLGIAVLIYTAWRPENVFDPVLVTYLVMLVVGGVGTLYSMTLEAFLPDIVLPHHLATANSLILTTSEVATLAGPALAGIIAATIGFWAGYASTTIGALTGVVALAFLGGAIRRQRAAIAESRSAGGAHEKEDGGKRAPLLDRLRAGYRFLFADRLLRWALTSSAMANLTAGFMIATFPVLVREVVGISSIAGIGFSYSALGAGGIVGGLLSGWIGSRISSGRLLVAAFAVFTAMLGIILGVDLPAVGLGALGVMSGAGIIASIHIRTLRQLRTPTDLIGRVVSASQGISISALPIGALLGGWLVEATGSYATVFGGIVAMNVAVTVLLVMSPLRDDASLTG
jgi:MFS family permease